jgi:hypothetical protein
MKKTITVSFTIPLNKEEWAGPSIIFSRWIPVSDSDVIVINSETNLVKIYFDKSCVSSLREITDKYISSWVNIAISKVKVEIEINDVEGDLVEFIYQERKSSKGIHHGIRPEDFGYEKLQKNI